MRVHTIWVADHVAFSTKVHVHDYYQMIYCQKSGGSFEIDGAHYDAVPGNVYFVRPMQPHAMQRGNNMRVVELKFLAEDEETAQQLRALPSVFAVEDDMALRRALKEIVKEGLSQALYSNESTNAALELTLIRILRQFCPDAGEALRTLDFDVPPRETGATGRNSDVQFITLLHYIETHMAERITLDDLSRLVHFNKSYLVERFKSIWGVPPMKYVNWIRVEKAKELLATTDKSITDIARETGFGSIHYFSRYFKEKERMSPQSYRAKYAEDLYAADSQT